MFAYLVTFSTILPAPLIACAFFTKLLSDLLVELPDTVQKFQDITKVVPDLAFVTPILDEFICALGDLFKSLETVSDLLGLVFRVVREPPSKSCFFFILASTTLETQWQPTVGDSESRSVS